MMPLFGDNVEGKKEVVGVLQIINKEAEPEVFTKDDYDVLSTIMQIAGAYATPVSLSVSFCVS